MSLKRPHDAHLGDPLPYLGSTKSILYIYIYTYIVDLVNLQKIYIFRRDRSQSLRVVYNLTMAQI